MMVELYYRICQEGGGDSHVEGVACCPCHYNHLEQTPQRHIEKLSLAHLPVRVAVAELHVSSQRTAH